jgi:hypothetical protein
MRRLTEASYGDIKALPEQLQQGLAGAASFEEAAQRAAASLHAAFDESIVLARVYATILFRELPPRERAFVQSIVGTSAAAAALRDETHVLTLMGSRGALPQWGDRHASKRHLAVPLINAHYVDGIPMIAGLMNAMGIGLEWIDQHDPEVVYRVLGRAAGLFYVEEASSAKDPIGRAIIPAQDFVRDHGVRTVFGIGGAYVGGTFAAIIVFCRHRVGRVEIERIMPCINVLKSATADLVAQRRFFASVLSS